jgi:hypothetical protein
MFYHEEPGYYVAALLVSAELRAKIGANSFEMQWKLFHEVEVIIRRVLANATSVDTIDWRPAKGEI